MNEVDTARGGGLTTEQIAAGTVDADGADTDSRTAQPAEREFGADGQASSQLLEGDELQGVIASWREIQAQFVDDPNEAVRAADALVADLMQRLARMFAAERTQLESRLASGDGISTEELRQGLQRYRSFFERLLAA